MSKPNFAVPSDCLDEKSKRESEVLLSKRDEILDKLVDAGLSADETSPYVYNVPTNLAFDCGYGNDFPMRSLWAIVVMARASFANAHWLDIDEEGYPEIGPIGQRSDFHRVKITDPFAWHIDDAIERNRQKMLKDGSARIVNGRFFKVA